MLFHRYESGPGASAAAATAGSNSSSGVVGGAAAPACSNGHPVGAGKSTSAGGESAGASADRDRLFFGVRHAEPDPGPCCVHGAVTVEVTIDQNGEVSDARVVSGPMGARRSALLTALQLRFPPESASVTRQMEVFSPYPPGVIPNGIQRVMSPAVALDRLTTANRQIEKLKAQQAEASVRGAAQLQEAIDSFTKGLDRLRRKPRDKTRWSARRWKTS